MQLKLSDQELDSAPITSPRAPFTRKRSELPTPQERLTAAEIDNRRSILGGRESGVVHRVSVVSMPLFTGWTIGATDDQYAAAADAAATGQVALLETLLDGLDINHQHPRNGTTLLLEACAQAQYSVAALLVSRGAAIDLANSAGFSPLMVAARWGGANTVRVLLAHGADVLLAMPDGKTALDLALAARHDLESHSKAVGGVRRDNETVDSCYLLQQAEDEKFEREEAQATAALEEAAQAEVARATSSNQAAVKAAADEVDEQADDENGRTRTASVARQEQSWLTWLKKLALPKA